MKRDYLKDAIIRQQLKELPFQTKKEIYEEITGEYVWNDLEEFVNDNFTDCMDAINSWRFGNKEYDADFYRFDGYNNIEGIYESQYEEEIDWSLENEHFEEVVDDYESYFDLDEFEELREETDKEELYTDFKEENKKELDAFIENKMFFAFGQEQFDKKVAEKGWDVKDIRSTGFGGYCLKDNVEEYVRISKDMDARLEEAKKDDDFFIGMLLYEMSNHEYGYTRDIQDTLDACDIAYKRDGWDIVIEDTRIMQLVNTASDIAIKIDNYING